MSDYSPDYENDRAETPPGVRAERERKLASIRLATENFQHFPKNEAPLIAFFSMLLISGINFDKRALIAESINPFFAETTLSTRTARNAIVTALGEAVLNRESPLYRALNHQRLLPLTFFGERASLACNYARSLQTAEAIVLGQQHGNQPTAPTL